MTTLPSCKSWTFTNSGLLIEDWLLKPARPLNLNQALHRLFVTDFQNQISNPIPEQNTKYQTIQTILYFSLPLLPAATVLLAVANVFNEAKYYTCPRRTLLTTRPYMTRLSQYLIVFFVLTGITSSLTWLAILPRYIPTSIGRHPMTDTESENHTNPPKEPQLHENDSIVPGLENAPRFITQLPAILTMQLVLRLTLCWLSVGLLMSRSSILHSIMINPSDKNIRYHIHQICLFLQGSQDTTLHSHDHHLFDQPNSKPDPGSCLLSCNKVQQTFIRLLTNLAIRLGLIHPFPFNCCPKCRHHWCAWSRNSNLCSCHRLQSTQPDHVTRVRNSNCCVLHLTDPQLSKASLSCSVGRTFLTTGLLLCVSLAICLPQVWTYHLMHFELRIEANSVGTTYPVWRLFNRIGQALYEYSFAAISFVIPSCTLVVGLILIGIRMIKTKAMVQHCHLHENIPSNQYLPHLYDSLMNHCIAGIIRDSMLVFWLGLIQACCTLPYFMTSSVHRLGCLLTITQNNINVDGFLSEEVSVSWPGRFNWLIIEVNLLFGDFLTQLTLLSMRIFEPLCFPLPDIDPSDLPIENDTSTKAKTVIRRQNNHIDRTDTKLDSHSNKKKQIKFEDHCELQDYADENDEVDHDDDVEDDDDDDDENEEQAECIRNSKTPSDSGQTSNNISPLPASHAISDVLLSPKFRQRGHTTYSINGTPTSPITTPLLSRIPEFGKYAESNSITMKTSLNSYVEPQTNMVSLTYSPRSRHPCRIQMTPRFVSQTSSKNCSQLMSPKSLRKYSPSNPSGANESPPPLPAPPKHIIQMLGDSSIYCTPHGSPQAFYQHKQLNYAIQYSPDLMRPTFMPNKHDSPAAFSFRQTDSGVTGLNGSVMESEPFEVDTIMT